MGQPIVQVDAFTDRPFAGNPAAVCVLDRPADPAWMQAVAAEMNLAETAFLHPVGDGFGLRWFTPTIEVDLCGHATLASAHVLWEDGHLDPAATAKFQTRSGLLTAARRGDRIALDFPASPASPVEPPEALARALGITPKGVFQTRFDLLVELATEEAVRGLDPDLGLIGKLPARGVIVTSRGHEFDIVSRFFAPASGVPEDPVTGSAHCALGPFWADRLGKPDLLAYQASRRGGTLRIIVRGDRVDLLGQAVTVLRGELL